jgi:hypothetical protein
MNGLGFGCATHGSIAWLTRIDGLRVPRRGQRHRAPPSRVASAAFCRLRAATSRCYRGVSHRGIRRSLSAGARTPGQVSRRGCTLSRLDICSRAHEGSLNRVLIPGSRWNIRARLGQTAERAVIVDHNPLYRRGRPHHHIAGVAGCRDRPSRCGILRSHCGPPRRYRMRMRAPDLP